MRIAALEWREEIGSKHIDGEPDGTGDSREVLVQGKERSAMFQCNRCDQSVDGRKGDTLRTRGPKDARCFSICRKSLRFEHVPLRQILLQATNVTLKALQNLRDDHSCECKRLCVGDHTAQFGSGRSRGRAEKINPDGTIHQDQTRFLRRALKSPFQMPLPKYWRIPFRLSERTSNSKALSTICRFVLRRVSFFALRTKLSLMSILVLIE